MRFRFVLATLFLVCSCDSGSDDPPADSDDFARPSSLTIEVDYEAGAAPYSGLGAGTVFADNVDALFPFLGTAYVAPVNVGGMEDIGAVADESFTSDDIRAIAALHRGNGVTDGAVRRVYVVFLDGEFEDETGTRDDILGVSLGRSGIIAMFKPVIESASNSSSVRMDVEQATLVHEFGHSLGLVENGIPAIAMHGDAAHAPHCSNEDCIMNWQVHTRANLLPFILSNMGGGSGVLFDDDCIADIRAKYGD